MLLPFYSRRLVVWRNSRYMKKVFLLLLKVGQTFFVHLPSPALCRYVCPQEGLLSCLHPSVFTSICLSIYFLHSSHTFLKARYLPRVCFSICSSLSLSCILHMPFYNQVPRVWIPIFSYTLRSWLQSSSFLFNVFEPFFVSRPLNVWPYFFASVFKHILYNSLWNSIYMVN